MTLYAGIELLLRDQVYDDCYPLHAVRERLRSTADPLDSSVYL